MNSGVLANSAAPWVDGWEPADVAPDPLVHLTGQVAVAKRPGPPDGTVDATGDAPAAGRVARADITFYDATPDGSAIRPMSGIHGAITNSVETAHQGESEQPWGPPVTMPRYAPLWGWDAGVTYAGVAPDPTGL